MNKQKILIFGATGSTGIYLAEYMMQHIDPEKYEIIAVGKRRTDYFKRYGIKYYSVDMSNKNDFQDLPTQDVYSIIILSGILPARMSGYFPDQYIDINTKGVLNIMEYFKDSGLQRVIYTISIADLYGYLPDVKELTPDMDIKFKYGTDHTIYAISKTAATEIIKNYYYTHNVNYYILRLPNIYEYSPEKDYYVYGEKRPISYRYMIDRAINGKDIEMWGDPNAKRNIVYVKDFCQIVYKAVFATCECGYYNVGADLAVSMEDQIKGIIEVFCEKDKISKIVPCPDKRSCMEYFVNIEKTKKNFGYEPQYGYIQYLEDYKKEMLSNRFEGL